MSRRRTSSQAAARRARARTAPPVTVASDLDPAAAELHRLALERREFRMGRAPAPAAPARPSGVRSVTDEDGTIRTTLPVMGMTCRSCEVRIQRYVGRLPHVQRVTASAVHGRVDVESSRPIAPATLAEAIGKAGYEIGQTPWFESDPKVWVTAGAGVALVAVIAVLAQVTGLADVAAGAGDVSTGGIAVALMLGLAAGVSTCMALVGGLVLALSAAFKARPASDGSEPGLLMQMRPAMVFVLGRIGGYAVFGAALGALGASVTMPPLLTGVLMIAVAIVMTLLGTRLTGLSPRIAGWSPTLPLGIGRRLGLGDGQVTAYSDTRAASLGAASFFLPCGFTQAIQLFALSTGSPLFAAAVLAAFALGTAPGLLAVAGLPVVVPSRAKPTLLRLVGVVVLGFAFVNGSAGVRLSGLTLPTLGVPSVSAAEIVSTLSPDGTQALTTFQHLDGYAPGDVAIRSGIPTRWTIESTNAGSCASLLIVPKLGIRTLLNTGSNTIDLPALPAGRISYMCSMGMYGGYITVVDAPEEPAG